MRSTPWTIALVSCLAFAAISSRCEAQSKIKVSPKPRQGAAAASDTQTKTESPRSEPSQPDATADQNKKFSVFGDASKFSRFSGWGGIGGAMGQWGLARSMLVMMPAVQKELNLTPEQQESLRVWMQEMRERGQAAAQEMRAGGQQNLQQMNITGALEMMGRLSSLLQENERGIAERLDKAQRKRLDQIALQMEGVTALLRPDVAQVVRLNELQVEQIQGILNRARMQQVGFWMQQAMTMRSERQRASSKADSSNEGKSSTPKQALSESGDAPKHQANKQETTPKSNRSDAGTDSDAVSRGEQDAQRRDDRRQRFQSQFEQMRSGADAIQEETVRLVLKVLAPGQRSAFDRLLGPPFDPNQVNDGLMQGRGSRASENATERDGQEDQPPPVGERDASNSASKGRKRSEPDTDSR